MKLVIAHVATNNYRKQISGHIAISIVLLINLFAVEVSTYEYSNLHHRQKVVGFVFAI